MLLPCKNSSATKFPLLAGLLILMMFLLWSEQPLAQTRSLDVPSSIAQAFSIYRSAGSQQFINALVKGGPMEGNIEIRSQIAILEKVETFYGKYQSYNVVDIRQLSDTTRLIYLVINFEKGAVFGKLITFKAKYNEIVSSFVFHTKPEEIFPEALLISQ